jgi:glycosyltransferase involved in cell wall biosynthesis
MKKKLLIFHPALAPYRIDQFNNLSKRYELKVVFIFDNLWNHKFDQSKLLELLEFEYSFLLNGPSYKGRVFRFGMLKIIREFSPHVVVGYEFSFTTLYLILLKKLGIISQMIATTIDDSLAIAKDVQSTIRKISRAISVRNIDYFIVLSSEVAKFYHEQFNIKDNHIITSPILQDPARLRKDIPELTRIANEYINTYELKDKKVLLFVGRFIEEKGLINFLDLLSPFAKVDRQLKFILVGDGALLSQLEAKISAYDLGNSFLLPGRYEGNQLLAWYLCASGFVLPSYHEPFGAVVNEALIFGLPVCCSVYAGARSLLNATSGIIFDPKDHDGARNIIENFLSNLPPKEANAIIEDSKMNLDSEKLTSEWEKI